MLRYFDSGVNCRHVLCRCAIYPKFIDQTSGVFDEDQTFELVEVKRKVPGSEKRVRTGVYALSLASEELAPGETSVHLYGQKVAEIQNEEYKNRIGNHPDPKRAHVGYYTIFGESLYTQEVRHHSIRIRWEPEHGANAHFQVEAFCEDASVSKTARRNDRARITETIVRNLIEKKVLPPNMRLGDEERLVAALPDVAALRLGPNGGT